MKPPHVSEYYAIVVATMTLLVVLIACYISIQLYQVKRTDRGSNSGASYSRPQSRREKFLEPMFYNPSCRADFLNDNQLRTSCRGYTSGISPSIDGQREGDWLCPGLLGVPI